MAIKFLNNIDLGQNELQNARVHVASSAPAGSGKGSIWLNSSTNELNFHNGTAFVSVMDDTNTNQLTTFTLTADSGTNQTVGQGETLDIAGGSRITTSVGNTNTVTVDVTNNSIGAESLKVSGNGGATQFLRSDGDGTFTWAVPTDTNTDTNTQNTYSTSIPTGTSKLRLSGVISGASNTTDDIEFLGSGVIGVDRTDASTFTISSSAEANVATNLGKTTATGQITITSSTGSPVIIGEATGSIAGLMSVTHHDKLDGIEASADVNLTTAEMKSAIGTGNGKLVPAAGTSGHFLKHDGTFGLPSYISYSVGDGGLTQNNFTNADHSKLNGIEASADVTDAANVRAALNNAMASNTLTIGDGSTTTTIPGNLTVTGTTTTNNVETVSTSNGVIFEGNAADDNEGTLLAGTLSADRTYTLPNKSGTVAMTSDITGTNSNTNTGDQLVFKNVASDSGTAVADSTTDTLTIAGSGSVSTAVSGDTLTITGTDTNTQLSTEQVQDIVGAMFDSNTETRISATYVDGGVGVGKINLEVDDMTANTNTQNAYSTSVVSSSGIKLRLSGSGAAGNTTDDVKFAGSGGTTVTRTDASTITITSTDNNTTYSAGNGLALSGTTFSVDKFEGALAAATSGIAKSQNTYTITHGLGNNRVNVVVTTTADPYEQVFPEINYASAAGDGTVLVIFGKTVSDSDYNVTITR